MTTVTATFSNGDTRTRADKRAPAAAWRLVYPNGACKGGNGCDDVGFSKDEAAAMRAAKSLAGWYKGANNKRHPYGGEPKIEVVATKA